MTKYKSLQQALFTSAIGKLPTLAQKRPSQLNRRDFSTKIALVCKVERTIKSSFGQVNVAPQIWRIQRWPQGRGHSSKVVTAAVNKPESASATQVDRPKVAEPLEKPKQLQPST